ncbi:MAG: hypothetical protein JSR82_22560 [Verrucomicrobia bacterium]|nr:hypothetical protein [Verrucomicrobiota bacterium]
MTDNELREIVLQALYRRRRAGIVQLTPNDFEREDLDWDHVLAVTDQLEKAGLVEGTVLESATGHGFAAAAVRISGAGVDRIEGVRKDAPPVHQVYNISGSSYVQAGNHNTLNVEQSVRILAEAIERSPATEEQKAEAKGWLGKVLSSEALKSTVSGLTAGVVRGVLEANK